MASRDHVAKKAIGVPGLVTHLCADQDTAVLRYELGHLHQS